GLVRDDISYLLVVSRGSSSNVARYLQYLFGTANRLTVAFATPSLYTVYEAPPRLGPAAVIGISQSGASPDVVAVLEEAKRQGPPAPGDPERLEIAARRHGRLGAPAARGRGARRRRNEDVPQLDRGGGAAVERRARGPRAPAGAASGAGGGREADRPCAAGRAGAHALQRRRKRDGRDARRQLWNCVRDRAEDP